MTKRTEAKSRYNVRTAGCACLVCRPFWGTLPSLQVRAKASMYNLQLQTAVLSVPHWLRCAKPNCASAKFGSHEAQLYACAHCYEYTAMYVYILAIQLLLRLSA